MRKFIESPPHSSRVSSFLQVDNQNGINAFSENEKINN